MQLDQAKQRLVDHILSGMSVKSLLNLCARMIGTPAALYLYNGPKGLLSSDGLTPETLSDIRIMFIELAAETEGLTGEELITQRMRTANRPFTYHGSEPRGKRYTLCPAVFGNQTAAVLCLPEGDMPPDSLDSELISLCGQFLALSLINRGMPNYHQVRMAMRMLLNAPDATYADVMRQAAPHLPPGQGPYRLIAVHSRRGGQQVSQNIQFLCGQLSGLLSSEWVHTEDSSAVILYAAQTAVRDGHLLEKALQVSGCCACISPDFSLLIQARLWYQRMYRLPAFLEAGEGECVLFSDWLDFGLFSETGLPGEDMRSFVMPGLLPLRAWDREQGTDYFRTLWVYVENGCNQKKSAAALDIHVNTLNYRLKKIAEQFGIHPDAPGALYSLPFSLRLLRYMDAAL